MSSKLLRKDTVFLLFIAASIILGAIGLQAVNFAAKRAADTRPQRAPLPLLRTSLPQGSATVERKLLESLEATKDGKKEVLVQLYIPKKKGETTPQNKPSSLDERKTSRTSFVSERKKDSTLIKNQVLDSLAEDVKRGDVDVLGNFWINNVLYLSVNKKGLEKLGKTPGVIRVEENGVLAIPKPIAQTAYSPQNIEWNIQKIGADKVWNELEITGQGVTVADLDTGVNWEHPALKNAYRGWDGSSANHEYNWFDAISGQPYPYDDNTVFHGTHTTGTMVGKEDTVNEIGVAPGAKWMAAKFLDSSGSGSLEDAIEAMQWLLSPKKPDGTGEDPAKAPDIVSNSWSSPGCNLTLQSAVEAWIDAGIIPVFANGNSGPDPSTVNSPADYPESFGVGATDSNDTIASFSSRGPSCDVLGKEIKPDVSAPGVNIRSSSGTNGYAVLSGTSMATPHVAGLAALLLSADPSLDVLEVEKAIEDSASDLGIPGKDNSYGSGRIDAYKTVSQYAKIGTLKGRVTDNSGKPLSGAEIKVSSPTLVKTATTDQNGNYSLKLPQYDLYSVTFSFFGYKDESGTVEIFQGETINLDTFLEPLPKYSIKGKVTKEDSSPLGKTATVKVSDKPLPPSFTDSNGEFVLNEVPEGSYELTATASGYQPSTKNVVVNGNLEVNFSLKSFPSIPLAQNFEQGLSDWTADGLWHIETEQSTCANANEGKSSAYYGHYTFSTCNYDTEGTPNSGSLTSPVFSIPEQAASVNLTFSSWFDTESPVYYDKRFVQIKTSEDSDWTTLYQDIYDPVNNPFRTWKQKSINLDAYKGQSVQIRFLFDTIDSQTNYFKGWYVDDIIIGSDFTDLAISQTAPETIQRGNTLSFLINYENIGLKEAQNTILEDIFDIPLGTLNPQIIHNDKKIENFDPLNSPSLSPSPQTSISPNPTPLPSQKGSFKISLGTLSPGQKGNLEVQFTVSQNVKMGEKYTNTASLTTSSPEDNVNNTVTSETRVITAELSNKLAQPERTKANFRFKSVLTVTNTGEVPSENVVLTVDLTGTVKFRIISSDIQSSPVSGNLPESSEIFKKSLRFDLGTLKQNESKTLTLTLRSEKGKAGKIQVVGNTTTTSEETDTENHVRQTTRITK